MSILRSGIDLYSLYTIIRRLAMPFTEWPAYKLGVIDDKGKFLIDKKDRTEEQYKSLTYLDIFVMNLKKALQKIPGANNKYITYAAALYLLREDRYIKFDMICEDEGGTPANTSSGGAIARVDEKEAKAFVKAKATKILKRRLNQT